MVISMRKAMKMIREKKAEWDGYMNESTGQGINNFYLILKNYESQSVDHVYYGNDRPMDVPVDLIA